MEKKPYSALQQQSLDETTFYMTSAINIINKNWANPMRRITPNFWELSCRPPLFPIWNLFY